MTDPGTKLKERCQHGHPRYPGIRCPACEQLWASIQEQARRQREPVCASCGARPRLQDGEFCVDCIDSADREDDDEREPSSSR